MNTKITPAQLRRAAEVAAQSRDRPSVMTTIAHTPTITVNGRRVPWDTYLRLTGRERAPDGTIRDLPNWRQVVRDSAAERERVFGKAKSL